MIVHEGDVRTIVPTLGLFHRVVMPLPHTEDDFLSCGVPAVCGGGWLHLYFFDGEERVRAYALTLPAMIAAITSRSCMVALIHRCGNLGPGKFRWCIDIQMDVS